MLNEVDEALRNLLKAEVVNGSDIEVVFDAPTRDWASRRNTPTINVYLYDVREDINRRSNGVLQRRDEKGVVVERASLPRFFRLAYLVTAWTQRAEDEHRLLAAVLACFMRHDVVPQSALPELLADLGFPLGMQLAYPPPENRQVSDVWSSLGGDLKPSLDVVVTLAVQPEKLYEIAAAVMAPLRLRAVGHTTMDAVDNLKHLPDAAAPTSAAATPKRRVSARQRS